MTTSADSSAPPSSAASASAAACAACGVELLGGFCHRCGEQDPAARDPSLRAFFRDAAQELTDYDSRALRTLRALLFRPGLLTTEHLAGRRRQYVGPLKLFLVVFAVLLFVVATQEKLSPAPGGDVSRVLADPVGRVVASIAAKQGTTAEVAWRQLTERMQDHMSWFVVLVPLLFAGVLQAALGRRRPWFTENLVFATHFAAFNYLLGMLLLPVQLVLARLGLVGALLISAVVFVATVGYMRAAVRRVYPGSRWGGTPGALALAVSFSLCSSVPSLLAIGSAALTVSGGCKSDTSGG